MPRNQRHVSVEVLQISTTEATSGTAAEDRDSSTAESLELWVDVTAETSMDFDFIIETSIDGTNFVVQQTISNVTAVGAQAIAISRVDDPLGKTVRARWVRTGGSATFSISLVRRE